MMPPGQTGTASLTKLQLVIHLPPCKAAITDRKYHWFIEKVKDPPTYVCEYCGLTLKDDGNVRLKDEKKYLKPSDLEDLVNEQPS